jgi:hypothetical protein
VSEHNNGSFEFEQATGSANDNDWVAVEFSSAESGSPVAKYSCCKKRREKEEN